MFRYFVCVLIFTFPLLAKAQFDGSAGTIGSRAIYKDSSIIKSWANKCTIIRGWQNIADTGLGKTTVGDSSNALGKSDGSIVSLGDAGVAIVEFENPIINENGFDFCVFENGFMVQSDSSYFLELAFVEVSSDGVNYFRFPATSFLDTNTQIQNGQGIDPRKINNLAGKFVSNYATPFDLEELKNIPQLDLNNITHVKIIDVVGSINDTFAERDNSKRKINDPWPTPFSSCGFDLDAVGVIHEKATNKVAEVEIKKNILVYPNPIKTDEILIIENTNSACQLKITDSKGIVLKTILLGEKQNKIQLEDFCKGLYFIEIKNEEMRVVKKLIVN